MKLVIILSALMLTGCLTTSVRIPLGPPNFQLGYSDGCTSGSSAAGNIYKRYTKRLELYQQDQDYQVGWDDGFEVCKARGESVNSILNN